MSAYYTSSNFNTTLVLYCIVLYCIVTILYIYGMTVICTNAVPFMFDSCTCPQHLWLPADGCSLQSKHQEAVKLIVQSIGNKLHKGRSRWPRALRPLACWDCGFDSRWGNGCSSFAFVACCVGSGLSDGLTTRPEECGVPACDRGISIKRKLGRLSLSNRESNEDIYRQVRSQFPSHL